MDFNFRKWVEQKNTFVSYTGIVLHSADQQRLIKHVETMIPQGWDIRAHHMTCNMKGAEEGPALDWVDKEVELRVKAIARSNKVVAVAVDTEAPSVNRVKHITVAVGPGARPIDSNELSDWEPITPITLKGIVKEVEQVGEERQPPKRPPAAPAPNDPQEFMKLMADKSPRVVRGALKGKFPHLDDREIDALMT
jgi:hypothetical protein